MEAVYEGSLVDCRTGAAHGRKRLGDHEQRLQERPPYMVRSNLQHPAPRENRARLAPLDTVRTNAPESRLLG
jgi:hypothetical protein